MSTRTRQNVSELKLRRALEYNKKLTEDLARPRIRVSVASTSLITYCRTTKDHLVPSVWGPVAKGDDHYAAQGAGGCQTCSIQ